MKIKKENLILDKSIEMHSFRGEEYIRDFFSRRVKESDVLVYFDPDIDGLISGMFICRALSMIGVSFSWYINSNREHGFSIPPEKVNGMTVICVDFSIPSDKVKEIVDAGCNLLCIDHHDIREDFIEYTNNGKIGVVINNQYSFEKESSKYLSGAGVVFESLVSYFGDSFNTRENRALVGLTLLSDIRNIENINARLYLQELYCHPYKGYIKYLIDNTIGEVDYGFGVPRLDRNYVDFKFSPLVNSCLRFNQHNEAVEFILGSGVINKKYHALQKDMIDLLMEGSRVIRFSNLCVIIVDEDLFAGYEYSECISNFIGLLASKYLDGDRSVIAYVVRGNEVGRASFRGRVNGLDYLGSVKDLIFGVGHESAFGIKDLKPSKELFATINDRCAKLEEEYDLGTNYINANNLSMLANTKAYDIAVDNIYCLSQNRKYIHYTGSNIKEKRSGAKYKEYSIDGVSVLCFDNSLDPNKDLILPIIERGVLSFYLNKKADKAS